MEIQIIDSLKGNFSVTTPKAILFDQQNYSVFETDKPQVHALKLTGMFPFEDFPQGFRALCELNPGFVLLAYDSNKFSSINIETGDITELFYELVRYKALIAIYMSDPKLIILVDSKLLISVWDIESRQNLNRFFGGDTEDIPYIKSDIRIFNRNGNVLLVYKEEMREWDLTDPKVPNFLYSRVLKDQICSCPIENGLLTCHEDGKLQVWLTSKGELSKAEITFTIGKLNEIVNLKEGKCLVITQQSGIQIWNYSLGTQLLSFGPFVTPNESGITPEFSPVILSYKPLKALIWLSTVKGGTLMYLNSTKIKEIGGWKKFGRVSYYGMLKVNSDSLNNRILKCVLMKRLKQNLPKDLITEVFNNFLLP